MSFIQLEMPNVLFNLTNKDFRSYQFHNSNAGVMTAHLTAQFLTPSTQETIRMWVMTTIPLQT